MPSSADWLAHPGTVGRQLLGPIHICGENGEELAVGEEGTIYFESATPEAMFQYHNDAKKTKDSRHPEHSNWSTLGDVGKLDTDGFLYLTDRKAFMIIAGGVNIYPQETEQVLGAHPKVADVAVIGVPNEDFGEEVKAVVQPANWADAGPALAEELMAFCRELSPLKCPRSIDFDPELPRHATGKLYKRLIRDRYWGMRESRIVLTITEDKHDHHDLRRPRQAHAAPKPACPDWVTIDQDRINKFADATGDHQWIHVDVERAKAMMPGGKTIAHGYLTLSLIPWLTGTFLNIQGVTRGINYGSNKVRFINMVQVDSRVRAPRPAPRRRTQIRRHADDDRSDHRDRRPDQ